MAVDVDEKGRPALTIAAVLALWVLAAGPVVASPGGPVLWLVVAASDARPAAIARAARDLGSAKAGGLVFQARDCGEKRNVFGVALDIADSPAVAKVALHHLGPLSSRAYVKRCAVVPQSLLALRVHAVDPSIAGVPEDTMTWEDTDRVSTAVALAGGRTLIAQRTFVPDDGDDPPEGRRVRMVLADDSGDRKALMDDCLSPGRATSFGDLLAFQCAGETAADYDVHQIVVFGVGGVQVKKIDWCKNPRFVDRSTLVCTAESLTSRGMTFRQKRVALFH